MNDEIIKKIAIKCKEQFQFEDDIKELLDTVIIPEINSKNIRKNKN